MKSKQVQEFKETEIGKIPVDWEVTELENICERVSVGHVGLTSKFFCGKEEGVLFLRSQNVRPGRINLTDLKYVTYNFHETHKKSQLHEGDLMIVRVGSNRGDCCVVPKGFDKLNCANIVFARPKSEFSSFLGHYFRSHLGKQKLDSISTGSAQGVINTKHIAKLLIPLPLPHQALAISHLLDTLDFKIQNLQNQNKTLEQIAQAIFKSWFVDFDGVTEFEDSDLGKIPKGWDVKKIGEVIELLYGKSLTKKNRVPGNIPVYGSSGIVGFHNESLSSKHGIIVGRKGNVGSVYWSSNSFYAIDTVYYVKTELSLHYVYRNFQNQNFINSDSSVPGLSRDQAYSLPILIPKNIILEKFENISSKIQIILEKNKNLILTLTKTRDTLLPKLMSGEIRA